MIDDAMWLVMGLALIGTIGNIYKRRWGFLLWTISNTAWAVYDVWLGAYAQAAQFAVFTALAVWGYVQWGKRPASPPGYGEQDMRITHDPHRLMETPVPPQFGAETPRHPGPCCGHAAGGSALWNDEAKLADAQALHSQAMACVDKANALRLQGRHEAQRAFVHLQGAFANEVAAARILGPTELEPSRSILCRSAASLAREIADARTEAHCHKVFRSKAQIEAPPAAGQAAVGKSLRTKLASWAEQKRIKSECLTGTVQPDGERFHREPTREEVAHCVATIDQMAHALADIRTMIAKHEAKHHHNSMCTSLALAVSDIAYRALPPGYEETP